jgi:hypothetical protein
LARRRIDADGPANADERVYLAMWLYGPIGFGVFGGVLVSTLGIEGPPVGHVAAM